MPMRVHYHRVLVQLKQMIGDATRHVFRREIVYVHIGYDRLRNPPLGDLGQIRFRLLGRGQVSLAVNALRGVLFNNVQQDHRRACFLCDKNGGWYRRLGEAGAVQRYEKTFKHLFPSGKCSIQQVQIEGNYQAGDGPGDHRSG
ncbi:MAG: hypothetical protein ACD_75C02642G0004 [uncultured bacterium]|nr:MAG: hypothetical protein ACD_75C02642G0004 [uncultured bacterium]